MRDTSSEKWIRVRKKEHAEGKPREAEALSAIWSTSLGSLESLTGYRSDSLYLNSRHPFQAVPPTMDQRPELSVTGTCVPCSVRRNETMMAKDGLTRLVPPNVLRSYVWNWNKSSFCDNLSRLDGKTSTRNWSPHMSLVRSNAYDDIPENTSISLLPTIW